MVFNNWLQPPWLYYWLFGLVLIWVAGLTVILASYILHYRRLVKKTGEKNLKAVLDDILRLTEYNQKAILSLDDRQSKFEKEAVKYLQKVGFLRFNPFSDTGGEQSFILAFLDGKKDGMVLSSLHSRGTTRLYAKQIKRGKSEVFDLSKEEQQVIQRLLKKN